jgi:cytosine/uracil/thiamine/allantoin permease
MIAWIAGAIAGVLTINTPLLVGPLANSWFAGGDVSIFAGILVAGIIYKLGNKIKN